MALSKVISVKEMTSFIQSGMSYDLGDSIISPWYDQISTVVTVFVLCNLYTRLSFKIASLYTSLFQGRQMT